MTLMAIDWGDAPTWLGAVMATVAAAAGWTAIRGDRRAIAVLQAEAAERAKAAREAQVGRVVLIPRGMVLPSGTFTRLTVRNGSDLPIFAPRLSHAAPGTTIGFGGDREVLDAGEEYEVPIPEEVQFHAATELKDFELIFRDSAQIAWRRWGDGRIEEVVGTRRPRSRS